MCDILDPNHFEFGSSGESQIVSCDTISCCCPPGNWGVKRVRKKNAGTVNKKRFKMTESTDETTVSYGTLWCQTNVVGEYTITLNCGKSVTASVS